jgi:hypothetical protein
MSSGADTSQSTSSSSSVDSRLGSFKQLLKVVSLVNFDIFTTFSLECIVKYNFLSKLVVYTLTPLAIVGVCLVTLVVNLFVVKDAKIRKSSTNNMVIVMMSVLYYSLAPVSKIIFTHFSCVEVDPHDYGKVRCRLIFMISY